MDESDDSHAVFADLRRGSDDQPMVHVHLDETPILRLSAPDAVELAWALLELGLMGRER